MRGFTIYDLRFTIADSSHWLSAIGDWLSRRNAGLRPGSLLTKWAFEKFEAAQSDWRLRERASVLDCGSPLPLSRRQSLRWKSGRGLPLSKTLREIGGAA